MVRSVGIGGTLSLPIYKPYFSVSVGFGDVGVNVGGSGKTGWLFVGRGMLVFVHSVYFMCYLIFILFIHIVINITGEYLLFCCNRWSSWCCNIFLFFVYFRLVLQLD